MKKNLLIKEAFLATIIVAVIVIPLSLIPLRSEFVKPFKQELDDFDIYDLIFAGKNATHPGVKDPNIILVQAADERVDIAAQVNKIKSLKPAVIGIDLSFKNQKDFTGDMTLKTAIMSDSSIVPGYSLAGDSFDNPVIKEEFFPREYLHEQGGYMNFPYRENFSVIRNFVPFFSKRGSEYTAFTVRIAGIFSPEAVQKIRKRHNPTEPINYYGNSEYYLNYSKDEFDKYFRSNQLAFFKGKIVLLGYFTGIEDSSKERTEDIFFSPMNQKPKGKSFPDIYGVVIHANILSMIINQRDYINMLPVWASFLLGICISFLANLLLLRLYKRYRHPYHIWFFVSQLLSIILVIYLFIKIYDWFHLKIALLPVVLAIVLSVELFDLYKMVAKYFNTKYHYQTIFSDHLEVL